MEKKRLAKPCTTPVDLRMKVLGECRAYQLGGLQHWLDDRGYRLFKELLSEANGRYTVGVFEASMAALAEFKESDKQRSVSTPVTKALVKRDKAEPELLPFDHIIQRSDERVKFVTTLEVRADDIVYTGKTIDVSSHAMKIVLHRAHCLSSMQSIMIDFSELYQRYQQDFLRHLPYRILHISHPRHVTHIVVERTEPRPEFDHWFAEWFEGIKRGRQAQVDSSDKVFNRVQDLYVRLYCGFLNRPVFFLARGQLKETFFTSAALEQLTFANDSGEHKLLWPDDFSRFMPSGKAAGMALLFSWLDTELYCFSSHQVDDRPLAGILAWLQHKPQWRVYLVASRQLRFPKAEESERFHQSVDDGVASYVEEFYRRYTDLTTGCSLLDIGAVFSNIDWRQIRQVDCSDLAVVIRPVYSDYQDMTHNCDRREPRIVSQGHVVVRGRKARVGAEALDFSLSGLKVALQEHVVPFCPGDRVTIDLSEWSRKSGFDMRGIPYCVVNINRERQRFVLKLAREKVNTPRNTEQNLNAYFIQAQKTFPFCRVDHEQNYRFALFSSLLAKNITGLPFFIGKDAEGYRIVQALGVTKENQKIRELFRDQHGDFDWRPLQQLAGDLSRALDSAVADKSERNVRLATGLYCYLDANGDWRAQSDIHFKTPEEKYWFIMRALSAQKYRFYHCAVMALSGGQDPQTDAVVDYVASLSLNKAKEVRSLFNSLIAVGELTNMSKLVAHVYQKLGSKTKS